MVLQTLKSIFQTDTSGTYTALPTTRERFHDHSPETGVLEKGSRSPTPDQSSTITSRNWRLDARTISDATLGLSDGLTVPFALTAGLAALGDTKVVVYAGLAELVAGGISMGVGGYLAASGEAQSDHATRQKTTDLVHTSPSLAKAAVLDTLSPFVSDRLLHVVTDDILSNPDTTVDFLLQHQHHISPTDQRLYLSAITIALGYVVGGFIPLLPYIVCSDGKMALVWSVAVMVVTLFGFGVGKTAVLGEGSRGVRVREGLKMVALGGAAAGMSVVCVRLVN